MIEDKARPPPPVTHFLIVFIFVVKPFLAQGFFQQIKRRVIFSTDFVHWEIVKHTDISLVLGNWGGRGGRLFKRREEL